MSDPLAGAPYGTANWTDFTHNWRKADGDFLQKRSVLRYATTAARDAALLTPVEPGMLVFNAETNRLEFRKNDGSWNGLYTVDGIIIEPVAGSDPDKKLRNPAQTGNLGLVFTATQIVTQVPLTTPGGEVKMDATGLTISTGTKDALLTTDTDSLNVDTMLQAVGLHSTTTLTVAGATTFSGAVTGNTTIAALNYVTAPRVLLTAATPAATNDATRRDYVDGQDAKRLALTGGTMSNYVLVHQENTAPGGLCFRARDVGNKPYIDFMDWAGNQLGYIQGTTANLTVWSKGDIKLDSGGGQVRTNDAIYTSGGNNRFFGQTPAVIGSGNYARWDFYPAGSSVDSMGSHYGYVGYSGSGILYHVNLVSGGQSYYQTDAAHVWKLSPNGSTSAQVEAMQLHYASGLMISKEGNATHTTTGHVFWPTGLTYNTVADSVDSNFYVNRIGGTSGKRFMYFGKDSVWLGSIYQNGTSGVIYSQTSDYRTKTVISPITDATDRLMSLKPWRVTWNGDPDRGVTDDFMAHEVQELVPDAVIGEKDAVDADGNEVHQQMGESRLMPLTVAALQDTIRRVDALERNLGQLSAA